MIKKKSFFQRFIHNEDSMLTRCLWLSYLFLVFILTWFSLGPPDRNIDLAEFNKREPPTPLNPWIYDSSKDDWREMKLVPPAANSIPTFSAKELKVLTWNIWHGNKREKAEVISERIGQILSYIENEMPDIIALQEVTKGSLKVITDEEWVRENYWVSDIPKKRSTFANYGTILMGKIQNLPLTETNRKLVLLTINVNNREHIIATTHLESYPLDVETRFVQFQLLKFHNGDLNIATDGEATQLLGDDYHDIFEPTANEETFTIRFNGNPLTHLLAKREGDDSIFGVDRRPDRILLSKSANNLAVKTKKMIGEDGMLSNSELEDLSQKQKTHSPIVWQQSWPPSDHLGLFAYFGGKDK